jgi:hypothetical protein
MKLSVITDEIADDLQTALQVAQAFGIDRVELRTLWGVNLAQADEAILRRAKSLLQDYGIGVCALATPRVQDRPVRRIGTRTDARRAGGEPRNATAVAAALFGGRRVFRRATDSNLCVLGERAILPPNARRRFSAGWSGRFPTPSARASCWGWENEHSCQVGTGAELAQVLRKLNSPSLVGVWDPGKRLCAGRIGAGGLRRRATVCAPHPHQRRRAPTRWRRALGRRRARRGRLPRPLPANRPQRLHRLPLAGNARANRRLIAGGGLAPVPARNDATNAEYRRQVNGWASRYARFASYSSASW